jgi:DNA modification methylase
MGKKKKETKPGLFDYKPRAAEGKAGRIALPGKLPPLELDWVSEIANSPAKDSGQTRTFYSYPAKFQAQIPSALVSAATTAGELVCDPYSGGGTTALECLLLSRRFVGYDLSPFAILIGKVKTTKVKTVLIYEALPYLLHVHNRPSVSVFDEGDIECVGKQVAREVNSIFQNIKASPLRRAETDFLKLALIHTVKIIGRRDFIRQESGDKGGLFGEVPARSAIPLFQNKAKKMLYEIINIPKPQYKPRFYCASNHHMRLEEGSVDLIVTSPPYKDLDVEYGLIQLQRREINRSKRSEVIWKILGVKPVAKDKLCGEKGDSYWTNLEGTLRECRRVLKRRHLAFFWIGFKTVEDQDTFCHYLSHFDLPTEHLIPVELSDDRVASSRSTHHGRDTGMMKRDYLIVTRAE